MLCFKPRHADDFEGFGMFDLLGVMMFLLMAFPILAVPIALSILTLHGIGWRVSSS